MKVHQCALPVFSNRVSLLNKLFFLKHRTSVVRPMLCSERENNNKLKDYYVLGKPTGEQATYEMCLLIGGLIAMTNSSDGV